MPRCRQAGRDPRSGDCRLMEKEMLPSIENFIDSLINTRFLNEQEMYDMVQRMAEQRVNRLRALDPLRNR